MFASRDLGTLEHPEEKKKEKKKKRFSLSNVENLTCIKEFPDEVASTQLPVSALSKCPGSYLT